MTNHVNLIILYTICIVLTNACNVKEQNNEVNSTLRDAVFQAIGNKDPEHRADRHKMGEIVVTFDRLPTKMSFNLPSFPCLVTENGISYYNGWTETYDATAGVGSCEPLMDRDNVYSRMWVESQNDARIVVRWRAALVSSDGIISHRNAPQVSPYRPGDWVDETYIIYPDGYHTRTSTVYTFFAPSSKPFGWDRDPPNYIFKFQEMLFLGNPGHLPEDDIQTKALTLIKMNGEDTTISYDPYPIHFEPDEEELYASFGDFWNSNIVVVNTKSEYHPFTIARTDGVSVSPYAPERDPLPGTFQSWPQKPNREEGYNGAALGHIILRTFYKKTDRTISQTYLSGFTNSLDPAEDLTPLARSWLQAPSMRITNNVPVKIYGYDKPQRAYLLDFKEITQPAEVEFEINASRESPLVNPSFLINSWGSKDVVMEINGTELEPGSGFRFGFLDTVKIDDSRVFNDALIVWIEYDSFKPVKIKVLPK